MDASAFWQFSLDFYARPGVAQACLDLQEHCQADVNLLLYLLFLAREGRTVDPAGLVRLESIAAPWRDSVVAPLRRVRQLLKGAVGSFEPARTATLRSEMQRVELAAERLQQETLERLAPGAELGPQRDALGAAARANLALYGRTLTGAPSDALSCLGAAFDRFAAES